MVVLSMWRAHLAVTQTPVGPAGSTPAATTKLNNASVVQRVEHLAFNQADLGSNPSGRTN